MRVIRTLILTPLPVEFRAVIPHLYNKRQPEYDGSASYEIGYFQGYHHKYEVVVCEPGMRNVEMALATERAINRYRPELVFLVGIAGGIKDVSIGDIIIANRVYDYESGKETKEGFLSRPIVESVSGNLLARAKSMTHRNDWKKRADGFAKNSLALTGAIAAGNKIVTTTESEVFKRLVRYYNDAKALEMEAIGFATAIKEYREVHGLIIRGISDLLENKTDDAQPMAAMNAAAFLFELLDQLNANDFLPEKTPNILEKRTPSKPIHRTVLPELTNMVENVQKMIARGNVEEVITYLQSKGSKLSSAQIAELIQLSERNKALSYKKRMGIISNQSATREHNQIVLSLIEFANGILKG